MPEGISYHYLGRLAVAKEGLFGRFMEQLHPLMNQLHFPPPSSFHSYIYFAFLDLALSLPVDYS